MLGQSANEADFKERLIANVKKEVKQIMEESVTRKFVHEDSSTVVSLCGAVEACLSQGLRRRALGLFKTSSTTALLHKISSQCEEAAHVSKKIHDIEAADPSKRSSSSSDSIIKPPILTKKGSSNSVGGGTPTAVSNNSQPSMKYLWIRIALYEKKLTRIIDHLVANANRYYDKDALVADSDYGSILSSLLVGPCALEYSKAKTLDHFWTDPTANDLVQRHIIPSQTTPQSSRRPMLNIKRIHTSSDDSGINSYKSNSPASTAKDYVESLHQNSRATLLYGKNNVLVHPKDVAEPMLGYLSLHQSINFLTIKWTPNQLMNGYNEQSLPSSAGSITSASEVDKSFFWAYVMNINIDDIVYVHCHQNRSSEETSGTIILVGHDGVQRPPIHFPEGGHMAQFLGCLETGLLPHGQLDPPLWSQKGIGRIFPWPVKSRRRFGGLPSVLENNDELPIDYVFRVVNKSNPEEFLATHPIMEVGRTSPYRRHLSSCSTNESSDGSSKSISLDLVESTTIQQPTNNQATSIALVCTTMKRQIISRAFYGWLAYCRHLSTVRTHLSGLVHGRITPDIGADNGLTEERWREMHDDEGVISQDCEVYRLVYYGSVAHEIRKEVWPYLLGHYTFGMTSNERKELDENTRHYYETTMSEWLALEAIVRQLDKEKTAHAVAKLSSGGSASDSKVKCGVDVDVEMENEVFEENGFSDGSDVEFSEEKSPVKKPSREHIQNNNSKSLDTEKGQKETELMEVDIKSSPSTSSYETVGTDFIDYVDKEGFPLSPKLNPTAVIVTDASIDMTNIPQSAIDGNKETKEILETVNEELSPNSLDALQEPKSACVSPASSNGGIYTNEQLELFGLNLHRIEKDVQRCDRNYWYFANENLDKLRNVITTYVYEHLETGYMQGMCDLLAPLLVIFDDESLSYGCFCRLMERMIENFPNGGAMDMHFANMRSLIQILDSEMYDLMHAHGDYTHFYFCYRWFLLDFKRELLYADVFSVWEVIWSAKHVSSSHFVLFLALSLLENYRDIILSNSMDFTDIIKFFNEMAERHNVSSILKTARNLVLQLQVLIENK
ncbi:hypothetical protein ACKWTF_012000 [Chironomus riparius]